MTNKKRSHLGKLLVLAALAAALLLLWFFVFRKCGSGAGPGKGTQGKKPPQPPTATAKPDAGPAKPPAISTKPCALRIDAAGVHLGGKKVSVVEAVAACKVAKGAELTVVGNAIYGQVAKVRRALREAKIPIRSK